jgi:signal peptidase II
MTQPTAANGQPGVPAAAAPSSAPRFGPARRWTVFVGLALAVVIVDQLSKAAVTAALAPGESTPVLGDLLRIVHGQNTGALFGLFKDNAAMFGAVSLVVIGLIVAYHARAAASPYLTVTLALLLGGAIGNMLDRLRLGSVVDFVDAGIGTLRFYTFNVADSAISLALLLLILAAIWPRLIEGTSAPSAPSTSGRRPRPAPLREGEEDPWDEEDAPTGPGRDDRSPGEDRG